MFERILVPLDGSPVAASVVPYATWFADKLGIPVALLSVVPTTEDVLRDITPMPGGGRRCRAYFGLPDRRAGGSHWEKAP